MRGCNPRRVRVPAVVALVLLSVPARAAWTPPGVDLTRPRILFRAADLPVIQARLDREPYVRLMIEVLRRIRQADGVALDDHAIASERNKARAAKNLAFLYAIDRTVVDGAVVPFATAAERDAVAARARDLLLTMYTRCRLAVPPPLGGFDRDINTSEELQQYATAYDTLRGAGYDVGAGGAAIVDNLVALASELYENYVAPASANGFATLHQNNHRSKSGAALAVTAIALAEYTPEPGSDPRGVREPAAWFAYGLDQVDLTMRYVLLTGDGAYAEGPFYLRYASQNLLPFWRAWDRLAGGTSYAVGGVDIPSFWRHPLLARTLQWALDTTLPDGSQAPTDDGNVGLAYYFGVAPLSGRAAPAFAWRWSNAPAPFETDASISLAADSIVNFDDALQAAPPPGSPTAFYVDGGAAIFRSDWTPTAVLAIVQAEHDTASEFGRDRDGRGVGPQSHEHAEPGAFLLHAFGERLALDPGYFSFSERGLVAAPEDHNIILVGGAGPTDYLSASIGWLADPFNRPPANGHAMLSHALDADGLDAARVTTQYGRPADGGAALIERRFLFADDRYLVVADSVQGPAAPPQEYTWLLHGNGGGDSGGTFTLSAAGGRWTRPGATLDVAVDTDGGPPAFSTADGVHEIEDRARATHTILRAAASGPAVHAVMLVYPSPAGREPAVPTAVDVAPSVAAVQLTDEDADRRVLALHRAASAPLTIAASATGMREIQSDGTLLIVDASTDAVAVNLAWAENATRIAYGPDTLLATRTRGRLGIRHLEGRVEVVADVADPSVAIGGLRFDPATADGACALLPGGRVVLGRERRVTLRDSRSNSQPAADPGAEREATPPQVVSLDGRGSCDADGDALTPHWELVAAPAGSAWSLEAADTWAPRLFVDRVGAYRVRLTVTDAPGLASRPVDVLVRGGDRCADGLDNDLDGLYDSDDADCDASGGAPIVDQLGHRAIELRVGQRARIDLRELISSATAHTLVFQTASTVPTTATSSVADGILDVQANRTGAARVVVSTDDGGEQRAFDVIDVAVRGAPACAGDCAGDGAVTVDEVLAGVAMVLGQLPFERCPALDGDADGDVRMNDLITAVRRLLEGCF